MKPYDLNDLLGKEKSELDKIKTAIEIHQAADKHAFEKHKFRTENLRFLGIALMTSLISLGASYLIETFKQKNANIAEVKKEFKELKFIFHNAHVQKQHELACELAEFDNSINDSTINKGKRKFSEICQSAQDIKESSSKIAEVDTTSASAKSTIASLDAIDRELQVLKQKEKSATGTEQVKIKKEITKVNERINTLVKEDPLLKSAIASSENIEHNIRQIESASQALAEPKDQAARSGSKSPVKWFKEDYFLQFGSYRILLTKLDKSSGIQVQVCKTNGSEDCKDPLLSNTWVRYDSPLQFSDNGKDYRINLVAIDHAGKNPFTLAAYITFETLD